MRQVFHIDFIKKSKIFFGISIGIMLVCLIINIFVFPTLVDIQFTGGTIISYTYGGDISESEIKSVAQEATEGTITFTFSENLTSDSDDDAYTVSLEFSESKALTVDEKEAVTDALTEAFPDNSFVESQSTSVNASKGTSFFLKCMIALAMAFILMVVYVAFRFKKIGGLSAGVTGVIALIHDVIIVYFTFVIFRMSIDDNFIAVVLMIIGYSLNDTIVIFDRIRENRKKLGPKTTNAELVNQSLNQCFTRTICTSITTIIAIGSVLGVALYFNIESIVSFALPMMIGLISGSYSSICIACPIWVIWKDHSDKKNAEKKSKKKESKSSASEKSQKVQKA